jgi:hypothetical protein
MAAFFFGVLVGLVVSALAVVGIAKLRALISGA